MAILGLYYSPGVVTTKRISGTFELSKRISGTFELSWLLPWNYMPENYIRTIFAESSGARGVGWNRHEGRAMHPRSMEKCCLDAMPAPSARTLGRVM